MPSKFMDPKNQFLMQMGASLLGQPYTKAPQNAFTGMQTAFSQGTNAYNNALLLQERREDRQDIKDKELEEFNRQTQMRTKFQSSLKGLPLEAQSQLMAGFNIDPGAAWKASLAMNTEPKKLFTGADVSDASQQALLELFGPRPEQQGYTAQEHQQANALMQTRALEQARATVQPAPDPRAAFGAAGDKVLMDSVIKQENAAFHMGPLVQHLKAFSESVESGGSLQPFLNKMKTAMSDIPGLGDIIPAGELSREEALNAATQGVAAALRQTMARDNPFSEKDRDLLLARVGGLMTTPEGRAHLINMLEMNSQRSITMGSNMRKYGYSEEGFARLRVDMGANASRGLYFDANGQLTIEGEKLNQMDPTYTPSRAPGSTGKVNIGGQTFPVRMGPNGPEYQGPNGWMPVPSEYQ